MTRPKLELADLEARIGHVFVNPSLAERALTHVSAPATSGPGRTQSYQRLEFLGDRVLGLVVSEMLYEAFPNASEGDLSVRLAGLVRRETCAEVADDWDVGPHVVMGQGEARAGGRKKAAILSDVCEALIGAVFLDAGFAPARALIRRFWEQRMLADAAPIQDAKTAVQEWAQARALSTPRYSEVERSGPAHLPRFVMQVELDGYEPERGEASSKRAAEQAAARAFLDRWIAS
jgi:ribonuclease III